MKKYAIICTRSKDNITDTLKNLLKFYSSCEIITYVVCGSSSIFDSYDKTIKSIGINDEDLIIFCHDDLEILENPENFIKKLDLETKKPLRAFVGLAGTTKLSQDAIWWNQENWKIGLHRGIVKHLDQNKRVYASNYGPEGEVVALDGLFLATSGKFIKDFNLSKPSYFHGKWDFYDIHYTTTAYLQGFSNYAVRFDVIHHSRGELVGRTSWHLNREAFIKNTKLPLQIC